MTSPRTTRTGLASGRGVPVTRARLARWWEALARDVVLVTVRGERPRFAAELAPEGRALGQLFDAVRKRGQPGIAQQAVDQARPALRDAVRQLAFRVPPKVQAPAAPVVPGLPAPTATATPAVARMPAQGTLRGSETEEGQLRYLTVDLRGSGTISYEGGLTLTLPLSSLERGRDRLRLQRPDPRRDAVLLGEVGRREGRRLRLDGLGRPERRRHVRAAPALKAHPRGRGARVGWRLPSVAEWRRPQEAPP